MRSPPPQLYWGGVSPSPSKSRLGEEWPGYQQILLRGSIVTLNVGPVGLAESLAALAPILALRPVAVLLQEAHVPAHRLKEMRALMHKHFPAYCLFTGRKARLGGRIDLITLIHVRMAARASLLDVTAQFAPIAERAPEALARAHFVRVSDPEGKVSLLLGNVHQHQAQESAQQTAVLELIQRVVERWGPESQHVIIGGDWNASLKERIGYSSGSATETADARLGAWARGTGLVYAAPESFTWGAGTKQDRKSVV